MLCLLGVFVEEPTRQTTTSRLFSSMKKLFIFVSTLFLSGCTLYAEATCQAELLQAAQNQANDSMREAWKNGSENHTQPVNVVAAPDGSMAVAQNLPREIVMLPDRTLGLSGGTQITIVQAAPQPTPLPTVAPQDSRIQTLVNGIDHIETTAILPEHLVVDQLDAIKKIADNGTLIAQQRFAVEQYKINSDAQLEWLRIAKGFTLWGFLFSVPFLLTVYWIIANFCRGWREWQKDKLEYRQKEIEAAERITRSE